MTRFSISLISSCLIALASLTASAQVPVEQFVNFETAHVHPLEKTPDGTKLLAVNTANNSLEVFSISGDGAISSPTSIPVGHDPVSVRARNNNEVWVANLISDSISIIDLSLGAVVRTLQTENEPSDIVFAGNPLRAFVTCAERESIQVFDLDDLSAAPQEILLVGEQPRAMAVSPDGKSVYIAFFESGNQTTVISGNDFIAEGGLNTGDNFTTVVSNDVRNPSGPYAGQVPVPNSGSEFEPPLNQSLPEKTDTQSIVVKKMSDDRWRDDNAGDWTEIVTGGIGMRMSGWDLKDRDVAILDTDSLEVSYQRNLGNILMAISVNPASEEVFVVGTDAMNHIRFEPNLNGSFMRHNVSRFTPGSESVEITDLNPHLDYSSPSVTNPLRLQSIGDPRAVEWVADGSVAYVSGMGSNSIIKINASGDRVSDPILVGEGPTGIVIHGSSGTVFVLNKFEGSVSAMDMASDQIKSEVRFFDPTPQVIKTGRPHLYNTTTGSGNGTISCASCHVDGKWDRLGWDLGNPEGEMKFTDGVDMHPLKGVKTTQTLIDILSSGMPLHWRGDQEGFRDFHLAFENLKGREPVSEQSMIEFENFLSTTYHPPNPYREAANNNNLLPSMIRGLGTAFQTDFPTTSGINSIGFFNNTCGVCHNNDTGKGPRGQVNGIGADYSGNENIPPDLRMFYRKVGFFYDTDESTTGFGLFADGVGHTNIGHSTMSYFGDYFGFLYGYAGGAPRDGVQSDQLRTAPIHPAQNSHYKTGKQATLNGVIGSLDAVNALRNSADFPENLEAVYQQDLGLVVHGIYQGEPRGFSYIGNGSYQSDVDGETINHSTLTAAAATDNSEPLTWTLVHPHVSRRWGVDQDGDGVLNRDDISDRDGDGVSDESDQYPDDASESADHDNDGIGDNADTDDDNDGVPDTEDQLPFNPAESLDSDADGIGNNADLDDDGDGVADQEDAFPLDFAESADFDGDGTGDNADPDADNDGIANELEASEPIANQVADALSASFVAFESASDGDWVSVTATEYNTLLQTLDNASAFGTTEANMQSGPFNNLFGGSMYSFGQTNNPSPANSFFVAFKRGTGNPIRGGNDIVRLSDNNGPGGYNAVGNPLPNGVVQDNQEYFVLKGSDASAYADPQYLGLSTEQNAPIYYQTTGTTGFYQRGSVSQLQTTSPIFGWSMQGIAVPANGLITQLDADGDGNPNTFDLDSDNDGIADVIEAGGADANNDGTIDDAVNAQGTLTSPTDSDNNGVVDFLEVGSNTLIANPITDVDNDGWDDTVDGSIGGDFDGDGISDGIDPDDDNDGVNDGIDAFPRNPDETTDTDADGIGNNADTDDDGDGVIDSSDAFPLDASESSDLDGDGIGDNADPDDNNDGNDQVNPDGVISNEARGITLDGNLNDWANYTGFAADPDDVTGLNDPLDWLQAWMAHDATDFYLAWRNDGPVNASWGQSVFIDTDSSTATGYGAGLPFGADYLAQAQVLYRYSGDGTSWAWDVVAEMAGGFSANNTELRVAGNLLGSPTSLRLAFVGSNAAYPQGSAEDLYPDGLYNSDAPVRFFEYSANAPSNSAPTATSQSVNVMRNQSLAITMAGADADNDSISFSVVAPPQNGTLSGSTPNVSYTPNNDYSGTDAFSFTVDDGQLTSGIATISITVQTEGELQITSNRVSNLTVDGSLTEWAALRSFGPDADDISGAENPIDWREGWIAHDEQNFYFAYRNDGGDVGAIDDWGFNLFIDSDRNPATGYRDGTAIGVDHLLQGSSLYRHSGSNSTEWGWTFVASGVVASSGATAEIGLSRQALNDTGEFDVIFVADNASIGGNREDQYPDGIYDANNAMQFFSYSTNGLPSIEVELLVSEANPAVSEPLSGRQDLYDNAHPLPSRSTSSMSTPVIRTGTGPISPSWFLLAAFGLWGRRRLTVH